MIHVDTSVVLDLLSRNPAWEPWSTAAFQSATAREAVAISDIVYAELAPGFDSADDLDASLELLGLNPSRPPRAALYLAGHIFKQYRRQRGIKNNVLADFLIGAHAAVEGAALLTRDTKRIRAYFPTVTLISP